MSTTAYEHAWRSTFGTLRDRNGAVEVTCVSETCQDELGPICRMRVVAFDPSSGGFSLERPNRSEFGRSMVPGRVVRVLASDETQRWEMITRVAGHGEHALNATQQVSVILMSPPLRVEAAQRRDYYRVSMLDGDPGSQPLIPAVAFVPADAPTVLATDAVDLFPGAIRAVVVNLGAGGIGVEAHAADTQSLQPGRYRCVLRLPAIDQPLNIDVSTVRVDALDNGTHCYIGMRFEYHDDAHRGLAEKTICRFSAQVQREQLKRFRSRNL